MNPEHRQWPKITNPAVIDDLVDQWHCGAGGDVPLRTWLGWSDEEYETWVHLGGVPEE